MNNLDNIRQDVVYALRAMRMNPTFAITAVLTLAHAIGANTAVFTVVRDVLLKPLEYPNADQLVQISGGAGPTRFEETKAAARSFQGIAVFSGQESLNLSGSAEPEVLTVARVSANFLSILEVNPIVGQSFLPADDSPNGRPVVLISSELWNRRFNRDPHIIGVTITLAATSYTIIGVLPPRFQFPFAAVDVWLTRPAEWPLMDAKSRALSPFLTIFGRLKPHYSLSQANAEVAVIQARYAVNHPAMLDAKPKKPVVVKPWKDGLVAQVRPMLWTLFGATSFVLLITCANVASLLLARATSRSREFAVRSALGASGTRLLKQVLTESILLATAGGAIGILLAAAGVRAVPLIKVFKMPRSGEIHLDATVLAFACAISICIGVLFGLAPALGASRLDLIRVLRAGGVAAGEGTPQRRLMRGLSGRGLLVVTQVALSVVLLIGAALLMESLARLRGENVGFNPAHLLTFRVSLPYSRYDTDQKRAAFFQEAVRQVESSPGIVDATAAMFLPMTGYVGSPVQNSATPLLRLNERPLATILMVLPSYFHTLEIPFRRGRDFTEQDKLEAERVAVIDEATARHFWPSYPNGQDPVGQSLLIGRSTKPVLIIGIVADAHQNLENTQWPETVYFSLAQAPQSSAMLAIRTAGGDSLHFVGAVRQLLRRIDPSQPISDIRTMDDLVDEEVGQRRLVVGLLGSFAGLTVLLALIGIYGVIAYSVSQRVQELGIRRALGAQHTDILRLTMGQGLGLTTMGIAMGIAGALALTRVLASLLFHTNATDPLTFVGIGLLFALAAIVATYIPSRRALRIDAMSALRND